MRAVGVIEMLMGVGILSPRSKVSSYAVFGWLLSNCAESLAESELRCRRSRQSIWLSVHLRPEVDPVSE